MILCAWCARRALWWSHNDPLCCQHAAEMAEWDRIDPIEAHIPERTLHIETRAS